jgi:hypothetical protein
MPGAGAVPPAGERSLTQPATELPSTKSGDQLTFSSLAQSRAAAAEHPRFGPLSARAHADSEVADLLAYDYAHQTQTPLYDLSRYNEEGFMRYSATGEPVTPESEARYKQMGENLHAATLALYNDEMANGTASADIFDKLVALTDKQPEEFRTIINWEGKVF